jgi:hypothetical protein
MPKWGEHHDLTGALVTVNALHAQGARAMHLVEQRHTAT